MTSTSLKDIKAIIVGSGFAGLAVAAELGRHGADVTIYEAADKVRTAGDIILFGPNATRLVARWGDGVLDRLMAVASHPDRMVISDKVGNILFDQKTDEDYDGYPNAYGYRGKTQETMYEYTQKLGVKFVFNSTITEYYETDTAAGIILNGERHEADFVIAADGIHSKGRRYVTQKEDRPKKSGFAIYRAWFPLDMIRGNPRIEHIADSKDPIFKIWITVDSHAVLTTNTKLDRGTAFLTHRDDADIQEDWTLPGKIADMQKLAEDFDPEFREIIQSLTDETLIDYKILWRDPVKPWVSSKGRVALAGDSAHPHIATSATGGAQGVEDGATIAACLSRAGKADVPLALKAYEKLRFERTALTQRMGWELRHRWHKTDWEQVKKNPEWLKFKQPAWLVGVDAYDYALNNWDAVVSHLKHGTAFSNTNVPEGYVHEDWTLEDLKRAEEEHNLEYKAY